MIKNKIIKFDEYSNIFMSRGVLNRTRDRIWELMFQKSWSPSCQFYRIASIHLYRKKLFVPPLCNLTETPYISREIMWNRIFIIGLMI